MEEPDEWRKEEIAEDYCFVCKDGGRLLLCDRRGCRKAYHPQCVDRDESHLEAGEQWTCCWHSCFTCYKDSSFQCYCCPSSFCGDCVKSAKFVHLRKTKGFCSGCLKLALMIEENADVDSDGTAVDFKDTETYEFLFKDYWEIVKEEESLTVKELHDANALAKKVRNYTSELDNGQIFENEVQFASDIDDMNFDFRRNKRVCRGKQFKNTRNNKLKEVRSRKKNFSGWGSLELLNFLTSLGVDTKEPLKQWHCHRAIENYIQVNNLLQPNKKKKIVLCDERLHSLFRKKKVKFSRIYNLLEKHFPSLDDEILSGSDEDLDAMVDKKFQETCGNVQRSDTENESELLKNCPVAIIDHNIKLVYLRRSLVKIFLENPETFERKVVGCFVRVKRDKKAFDYSPSKIYQLGRVDALKRVPNEYTVGEISTNFELCVSNIWKAVSISMLSDDDFEEEECEDLRELVKKGLFKRPTVVALGTFLVINNAFLAAFGKAGGKNVRQSLQLITSSHDELEQILSCAAMLIEGNIVHKIREELKEKIKSVHEDIMAHWIQREIEILQRQIDRVSEKGWNREKFQYIERRAALQTNAEQEKLLKQMPKVIPDAKELMDASQLTFQSENKESRATAFLVDAQTSAGPSGKRSISYEKVVLADAEEDGAIILKDVENKEIETHKSTDRDKKRSHASVVVIEIDDEYDESTKVADCQPEIIVVDDEDEEPAGAKTLGTTPNSFGETFEAIGEHKKMWYYVDPSGREQGPFTMAALRYWKRTGYFDNDFRVWRTGETSKNALLLTEALLTTVIEK